jgi:hypothetical protein
MIRFGTYETVEELSRSEAVVLYSARRGDGPSEFGLEVLSAESFDGKEGEFPKAARAFLERVSLQKMLAELPGSRWVRVHDMGKEERGAWYAADLYPASAARLIEQRQEVAAEDFTLIASCVLDAMAQREGLPPGEPTAHWALSPRAIVVRAAAGKTIGEVALCDPVARARTRAMALREDLRMLGSVLHQLVTHEPARLGMPIAPSAAWERLGAGRGEVLREACDLMVNAGPEVTIARVREALDAKPPKRRTGPAMWIAAAAAALLIAGAAAWYFGRGKMHTTEEPRSLAGGTSGVPATTEPVTIKKDNDVSAKSEPTQPVETKTGSESSPVTVRPVEVAPVTPATTGTTGAPITTGSEVKEEKKEAKAEEKEADRAAEAERAAAVASAEAAARRARVEGEFALKVFDEKGWPAGVDRAALNAKLAAAREKSVHRVLESADSEGSLRKEQGDYAAMVAKAGEMVEAVRSMDALLASGEPYAKDGKIEAAAKQLADSLATELGFKDAAEARVGRLREIAALREPDALLGELKNQDQSRRASRARTAWAALRSLPEWPRPAQDLRAVATGVDELEKSLGSIDEARRSDIVTGAKRDVRRLWLQHMTGIADGNVAAVEAGFDAAAACGAAPDSEGVTEWMRQNWKRYDLVRDGAKVGGQPQDRGAKLQQLVQTFDQAGFKAAEWPELDAALKPFRNNTTRDLQQEGPGRVSPKWKAEESGADGESVTYTWTGEIPPLVRKDRPITIRYRRVKQDPTANTATYLGTTEVSIGMFRDGLVAMGRWDATVTDALKALKSDDTIRPWDIDSSGRFGPQRVLAPSATKGAKENSNGWTTPWQQASDGPVSAFAEGIAPEKPEWDTPMTHVSGALAAYVANALGCRLPTSAEWGAATTRPRAAVDPNLRDQRWARQYAHITEVRAKVPRIPAPNDGIFLSGVDDRKDVEAVVNGDDGWLWLRPVNVGSENGGASVFHDLVGNVAEFVLESPAKLDTPEAAAALVRNPTQPPQDLRVIGGSAMSGTWWKDDPSRMYPPQTVGSAYSDVGFRLAFTARGGSGDLASALSKVSYRAEK